MHQGSPASLCQRDAGASSPPGETIKVSDQINQTAGRQDETTLFHGDRLAWIGGVLAGLVALGAQMLIGVVYNGTEARALLQALVPPAGSLGGAVAQSSATILALMLTLLGLSRREMGDLEPGFFRRIQQISLLSSFALASAILLLLFLSIPLQQSANVPAAWFQGIYYALLAIIAGIAGLVVAIVIMLYNAIGSIIRVVRPSPAERRNIERAAAGDQVTPQK